MTIRIVPLEPREPGRREAMCAHARWLTRLRLWSSEGNVEGETGADEESGLLVLTGTHDLAAGAAAWISRGIRETPFAGKPVAVFLPPNTRFHAAHGRGDVLVVGARRPELPKAPARPGFKGLLPLAGSGKAFDIASGSWQPLETFPDAAEAILPRRLEPRDVRGVTVTAVFAHDYKTRGLGLAEAVLPEGASLVLPLAEPGTPAEWPEEWAVYYRAEGALAYRSDESSGEVRGDGVLAGAGRAELRAQGGRVYLAVAVAGPKPAT